MRIKDLYRSVTDAIIAELEAGAVPWVRPWKGTNLMPTNAATKMRYNGINIPILWYSAEKRGYADRLQHQGPRGHPPGALGPGASGWRRVSVHPRL